MPINYFRRSRKDMVAFARCSETSLTEETGEGRKIGASLVICCENAVRHGRRCPVAHTEMDNLGSSPAAVGHAG